MRITDDDIKMAEELILPKGERFNDERRTFIKSTESRDVLACPGSGKTTALLAKLYILAQKMPFPDGRGICVLTHTNVAIDEIRSKIGTEANILFQYPNFFGTIQAFVNYFLAIPAYKDEFHNNVQSIDSDQYSKILQSRCNPRLLVYLQKKHKTIDDLSNYWFNPFDLSIVESYKSTQTPLRLRPNTATYRGILQLKKSILEDGYLNFNDAYALAFRHLQRHPLLKNLFVQRFCFCFIDEAQDTNDFQRDLINEIFPQDNQSIIQQRLGDNNQAIYSSLVKSENLWVPYGKPPIYFSDTMRFGKTIVNLLRTIRYDTQISLEAHPTRTSLPPVLLVFKNGEHGKVLKNFADLINAHRNKWASVKQPVYKAIGWIGKDKTAEGKACIPLYYPAFNRSAPNITVSLPNLRSFIEYLYRSSDNPKLQKDILLNAIIEVLFLAQQKHPITGKYFSKSSYIAYMKETYPLYHNIFFMMIGRWLIKLANNKINIAFVYKKMRFLIKKYILKNRISSDVKKFLHDHSVQMSITSNNNIPRNQLITPYGDIIQIATVHGVKGETHTATLYLESSYYELETKRLLPFMKGEHPNKLPQRLIENLKIAHVGLSRATHLVVFACNEECIKGAEEALRDNGWQISQVK